ncbi:EF-hand domain-containing protein [Asticcacaulis sp. YBE204]|uniref:EF-hand domain-containing protein n=1 Tax=Asticcacaulis sp. YBE204 TaxID=1282363 RepID=UPI0003C3E126|nr:EF-hand domain-containing protein [Asticcacaulis sp. YBE204]ESQ79623.1 hypothetical protein AEYBE204_07210 [Asticcacaulis sp. YBE204]
MKYLILALALSAIVAAPAFAASHSSAVFIEEQDLNGDGKVSTEEFKTGRKVEFVKADFNEDGALSEVEYVGEFEGRLMVRLSQIADPEKRLEENQRQMRQARVRFGVLDTDKNGSISFEEYLASGLRMIGMHDRDKDGFVTDKDVALAEKAAKEGKNDFVQP